MEMNQASALKLGDLGEADPGSLSQCSTGHSQFSGQDARQIRDRSPPQRGNVGVPQDRGLVVETLGTERLAESRIVLGMAEGTPGRETMRADRVIASCSTGQHPTGSDDSAVNGTERGCGERDEDPRMTRKLGRYALCLIAGKSGPNERECVAAIELRAGRAA